MDETPHIGMQLWEFNGNRRIYHRNENGKAIGGPIWREHWVPVEIIGETRVSWLIGPKWMKDQIHRADKLPKKSFPGRYMTNEDAIDRAAYVQENRHQIAEKIYRLTDYATLKSIAALLEKAP